MVARRISALRLPAFELAGFRPLAGSAGLALGVWLLAALSLITAATAQDPQTAFSFEDLPPLPAQGPRIEEVLPVRSPAGDLLGATWLDGRSPRRLAVAFAPWNGAAWGPREPVAPPAAGSQLALTATATRDGDVLLAWSAFDGEDDEILWSRRAGTAWSTPARLAADNGVPDITPALFTPPRTDRSQALAAWSRYQDGQYRVVLSRFDGRSWSEPVILGPAGSVFPSFAASPASRGTRLLFRTARPRGWRVVELDPGGRPRRAAQALTGERQLPRPEIQETEAGLRFSWQGFEAGESGEPATEEPATWILRVPWESLP